MSNKKLILDYAKWHCGDGDEMNGLGKGKVSLLNDEGYMCCLGQWCNQLGAPLDMLKGNGEPGELQIVLEPFNYAPWDDKITTRNTNLSSVCIVINDDPNTTPFHKIIELKKVLAKAEIDLEVINVPLTPIANPSDTEIN